MLKKSFAKKVETLVESFVLLDSLIFKLVMMPDKELAVLAIPEICVRQDYCIIPHKSICRSSRSSEDLSHNERQVFHPKFDALFKIFHKGMSYMSTIQL